MAMNEQELRAAIEAIIFVSGEPVKPDSLEEALSETSTNDHQFR